MKPFLLIVCLFTVIIVSAQENEFILQGQVVDSRQNPVADAYIFNIRNSVKDVSKSNGVFSVWVLPADSIIISHISYLRKVVTVYQILKNPVVKLDPDTVNIKPVNVSASQRTDYEKAMKNIQGMGFDFRPLPDDAYTESERMKDLLNTENRVQKSAASALTYQISPSEIFGKLAEKRKKKKEAKQFSSTRKSELQE
jgi:hypothetical protein